MFVYYSLPGLSGKNPMRVYVRIGSRATFNGP